MIRVTTNSVWKPNKLKISILCLAQMIKVKWLLFRLIFAYSASAERNILKMLNKFRFFLIKGRICFRISRFYVDRFGFSPTIIWPVFWEFPSSEANFVGTYSTKRAIPFLFTKQLIHIAIHHKIEKFNVRNLPKN